MISWRQFYGIIITNASSIFKSRYKSEIIDRIIVSGYLKSCYSSP